MAISISAESLNKYLDAREKEVERAYDEAMDNQDSDGLNECDFRFDEIERIRKHFFQKNSFLWFRRK